jgi:hypothetical protein
MRCPATLCLMLALTSSARAVDPPTFDWTKHNQNGDVNELIRQNLRGRVLFLGAGSVEIPASGTLTRALVNDGKLSITVKVDARNQDVRFENLVGAKLYCYRQGITLRDLTIGKTPQVEHLVSDGMLTISIMNPAWKQQPSPVAKAPANQAKPAPLLPGPESGYKPRVETFARLAAGLSKPYSMPGRNFEYANRNEVLDAAAKYPNPRLQIIAKYLLLTFKESGANKEERTQAALERAQAYRDSLRAEADEIERRAKNGEYISRDPHYVDAPDGRAILVFTPQDFTAARLATARAKRDQANRMSDQRIVTEFKEDEEKFVRRMWDELSDKAWPLLEAEASRMAGPKANLPLVSVIRPNLKAFQLRNGDRQLTDVLVVVDFAHERTLHSKPYNTFRNRYFIPIWRPNQIVELTSLVVAPDPITGSIGRTRKTGNEAKDAPDLTGLAGVIQTSIRVDAAEASQELTATTHMEAVELVTKDRLAWADSFYLTQKNPDLKGLGFELGGLAGLLPPESELGKKVKLYLTDPKAVQKARRESGDDEFFKMLTAGKRYEGQWKTTGSGGRYQPVEGYYGGLLFVSSEKVGKEVRAELYDSKQPETRRMFAGGVLDDPQTSHPMLVLAALAPTENPPTKPKSHPATFTVFDDQVQVILLRYDPAFSTSVTDPNKVDPYFRPKYYWSLAASPDRVLVASIGSLRFNETKPNDQQLAAAKERVRTHPMLLVPDVESFKTGLQKKGLR